MTIAEYRKANPDPWKDLDTLNACPCCEGALLIMGPCPVHGGTPFNTYLEIHRMRNMPEWECKKCGEKGKNDLGEVPWTHFCPGTEPPRLDLSSCHTPA